MAGEARSRIISQQEFAKMVGTSHSTIQSIEIGRLNVSHGLARRIGMTFGVMPESLIKPKGKPKDWLQRDYTPQAFKNSRIADVPKKHFDALSQICLAGVEAVLLASNAPNKKRFQTVMISLREWIQTTFVDFGLRDEWKRELARLQRERGLAQNIEAFLASFPDRLG